MMGLTTAVENETVREHLPLQQHKSCKSDNVLLAGSQLQYFLIRRW
jgi:hypothetical protein